VRRGGGFRENAGSALDPSTGKEQKGKTGTLEASVPLTNLRGGDVTVNKEPTDCGFECH